MNQSARKALLVWGGFAGHEPEQCAGLVGAMLEGHGFEVRIESSTEAFADPDLGTTSLIVPIITKGKIEKHELDNLIAAVRGGTGLGGFHAMCDAFREAVEYQFMTGGQFVAHPGGMIDYRVHIVDRDDPITSGLSDFDYHSEQFYLHVDPSNHVLATTVSSGAHVPWTKGTVIPVVWKRRYGEGRVFYSSLGHNAAELSRYETATFIERGLLWAAR